MLYSYFCTAVCLCTAITLFLQKMQNIFLSFSAAQVYKTFLCNIQIVFQSEYDRFHEDKHKLPIIYKQKCNPVTSEKFARSATFLLIL